MVDELIGTLEPMSLSTSFELAPPSINDVSWIRSVCVCCCCENSFSLPGEQSGLLTHLFMEHRLVIADVDKVPILAEYIGFWKHKFKECSLAEYCTTMLVDTKTDDKISKDEKYFLLSDIHPYDKEIRSNLQKKRLEQVLEHQKLEREDKNYIRECLFCRTVIKGVRFDILNHLFEKHNFYIAKLDNLVFTADLIESLNDKITHNICTYCEKTFSDRNVLKEHMRKKGHKKINPNNSEYDKYFISNYIEIERNWQSHLKNVKSIQHKRKSVKNRDSSSDSDNNWSDWDEKDDTVVICLFCKYSQNKYADVLSHMVNAHNFDFETITKNMNFYEKLKIVNFIRRQVFLKKCIKCFKELLNIENLLEHMVEERHFILNNPEVWNQPEFYFPTFEDDGFLFGIRDSDDSDNSEFSEEIQTEINSSSNTVHISQEVAMSVLDNK